VGVVIVWTGKVNGQFIGSSRLVSTFNQGHQKQRDENEEDCRNEPS
jgi:hypothetical protein